MQNGQLSDLHIFRNLTPEVYTTWIKRQICRLIISVWLANMPVGRNWNNSANWPNKINQPEAAKMLNVSEHEHQKRTHDLTHRYPIGVLQELL